MNFFSIHPHIIVVPSLTELLPLCLKNDLLPNSSLQLLAVTSDRIANVLKFNWELQDQLFSRNQKSKTSANKGRSKIFESKDVRLDTDFCLLE